MGNPLPPVYLQVITGYFKNGGINAAFAKQAVGALLISQRADHFFERMPEYAAKRRALVGRQHGAIFKHACKDVLSVIQFPQPG